MIKKVKASQLRAGMFIHDLNCSWFRHPFLKNKIKITDQEMIDRILEHGIEEVYIDTSRGLDVQPLKLGKGLTREIDLHLVRVRESKTQAQARRSAQKATAPEGDSSGAPPDGPPRQAPLSAGPAPPPRPRPNGKGAAAQAAAKPPPAPKAAEPAARPQAGEPASSPSKATETWEGEPTLAKRVPLAEEMADARRVRREAEQVVKVLMEDARLGRQIHLERVYPLVGKIVDSILRNHDALLTLSAIKRTDEQTYMHSLSVAVLMVCFGRSLGLERDQILQAGVGALLHDVGKVKLPQEVIQKAGKLTREEEETFKEHVAFGEAILSNAPGISPIALAIAREHHERYDGTGYPQGLKGEGINLFGQMASVVNMYDILTSDRWYRKGMEPTEALSKLLGWSKFHFSEEMVHKFIRCIGVYPIGTLVRMESGLLAVVVEQGSKDLLHPVVRAVYDTKREWFIKPCDLDLSSPPVQGISDRIICHESPGKWKILPQSFLVMGSEENGSLSRRLRASGPN